MSLPAVSIPGLPIHFDNTFGATMIGGFVTTVLYGILIVQVYMYFQRSKGELIVLRLSIWLLGILNTVHLICIIHSLYFYMVTNFANPLVLAQIVPWSLPLVVFFTTATDLVVQAWFTFRVWTLSKGNRPLTFALAACSICVLGISTGITIRFYQLKDFANYSKANWLVFLGLGLTVATDFLIAISLCYYLFHMRSVVHRTSTIVNGLMIYAVNTGLLTCILCIACLITPCPMQRLTEPDNFIFIGIFFPLSSTYSNALLGSLNARDWFRNKRDAVTIPLSSLGSTGGTNSGSNPTRVISSKVDVERGAEWNPAGIAVQVNTDVVKATL
ncbi:uncharacterized protein PHACADRAFT_186644 [Phanerochaete carnosa HHB-10118-sp]|uniref:DUF6534 domain-containing protein n=1 Tax=Phanerochaete carnosa (strain HHB-10118-sp) TaxID=650164 RepID=K5W092_PHACS|nr:uncharacterized protein PHACADRAFT_186644 [Phanerochaete carnosa HHB-10118-sp]EKM52510.1 hypothetical protein PHACADRAFT_186644 [Phanerochaete carnosa HHB-10118-sp]